MSYAYTLYDSIDEVDPADWEAVWPGVEADPFMDPRFVATVERSMSNQGRYWTVLIRDGRGRPAAAACLSLMSLDMTILAPDAIKQFFETGRRVFSRMCYYNVLLLGLPVSAGQSHLRIRSDADLEEVLRTLDRALRRLGACNRARLIIFKEIAGRQRKYMDKLCRLGYRRMDSLPMNRFALPFGSFDAYCAALKSSYRRQVRPSLRKYEKGGLRTVRVSGDQGADRLYTDQMHTLYENLLRNASERFEHITPQFYRELLRRFGDRAALTIIYDSRDRPLATSLSLSAGPVYHLLYFGVDLESNRRYDAYFNLVYRELDHAMRRGAADIVVGQTADTFKSRLGCYQQPLYLYVKGLRLMSPFLSALGDTFLPRIRPLKPRNILLSDADGKAGPQTLTVESRRESAIVY